MCRQVVVISGHNGGDINCGLMGYVLCGLVGGYKDFWGSHSLQLQEVSQDGYYEALHGKEWLKERWEKEKGEGGIVVMKCAMCVTK